MAGLGMWGQRAFAGAGLLYLAASAALSAIKLSVPDVVRLTTGWEVPGPMATFAAVLAVLFPLLWKNRSLQTQLNDRDARRKSLLDLATLRTEGVALRNQWGGARKASEHLAGNRNYQAWSDRVKAAISVFSKDEAEAWSVLDQYHLEAAPEDLEYMDDDHRKGIARFSSHLTALATLRSKWSQP